MWILMPLRKEKKRKEKKRKEKSCSQRQQQFNEFDIISQAAVDSSVTAIFRHEY